MLLSRLNAGHDKNRLPLVKGLGALREQDKLRAQGVVGSRGGKEMGGLSASLSDKHQSTSLLAR